VLLPKGGADLFLIGEHGLISLANANAARVVGGGVFALWNITGAQNVECSPTGVALDIKRQQGGFLQGLADISGVNHLSETAARSCLSICDAVAGFLSVPVVVRHHVGDLCRLVPLDGPGPPIIPIAAFEFEPPAKRHRNAPEFLALVESKPERLQGVECVVHLFAFVLCHV
jgi:hypothetical protein